MEYEFHEVANIFPMMTDEEFAGLVKDIKENGQIEPVWLYQNKIIDGRNRYKACQELGIPLTKYLEWNGEGGNIVSFVTSKNLHRRHLTPSQLSMVAFKIKDIFKPKAAEAQKRTQLDGRDKEGNYKTSVSADLHIPKQSEISHNIAAQQAADLIGTSMRNVYKAQAVVRDGIPEVAQAVEVGKVSIGKASNIVKLPQEQQPQALKNALEGKPIIPQTEIIEEYIEPDTEDQSSTLQEILPKPEPKKTVKQLNEEYLKENAIVDTPESLQLRKTLDEFVDFLGDFIIRIEDEINKTGN